MQTRKYYIDIAKCITTRNFEKLKSGFQKSNNKKANDSVESNIHISKYKAQSFEWLERLENVYNLGEQFLENIIAHGSFGDYTNIPYSDLDITLHLKEEVLSDKKLFNKFAKWEKEQLYPFLYFIDPLQHHGPFYLWDELINNYSNKVLPTEVYNHSWGVRESQLNFKIKSSESVATSNHLSIKTCDALLNNKIFRFGYSMYNIKRYLSNLMLVPAFYYTDSNNAMPKKDSFAKFYKEFGEAALPVKLASELRTNWDFESDVLAKLTQVSLANGLLRKPLLSFFTDKRYKSEILNNINPLIPNLKDSIKSRLDVGDSK